MSFELHKEAIEAADDLALTKAVHQCVLELRRRALLSKGYSVVSIRLAENAMKNAALKAAGMPHDGVQVGESSDDQQ